MQGEKKGRERERRNGGRTVKREWQIRGERRRRRGANRREREGKVNESEEQGVGKTAKEVNRETYVEGRRGERRSSRCRLPPRLRLPQASVRGC